MKLFWTSTFNNWIYYLHWLHIPSRYGGRKVSILCRTLWICRPSFHHPVATPTNHCKLSSKFMISPFSFSYEWQNFCTPFVAAVVVVATSHQMNYVGPDLTTAGDVWEMRVDLQWNLNNYFDASSGLFSIHPCVRPSVRATSSLSRTYSFFQLPPISFECSRVLSDLTILPSQMKQNKRYVRPFVCLYTYIQIYMGMKVDTHTYARA